MREHVQGVRCAVGIPQAGVAQQFVIDLHFFGDAQAVRHLDDIDPVDKGFIVFIVAEGMPLGFVGVRQHHAIERDGAHVFGAVVVSFLGGGEQWVQHLDRCLEHFHELEQALVGPAQPPGKGVGVRIILGEVFQLANIHLAHQGGNVLVVFIAGFGFRHRDLVENGGVAFYHAKLAQVAAEFMQTLDRPGGHDGADIAAGNAVFFFEDGAVFFRVK